MNKKKEDDQVTFEALNDLHAERRYTSDKHEKVLPKWHQMMNLISVCGLFMNLLVDVSGCHLPKKMDYPAEKIY